MVSLGKTKQFGFFKTSFNDKIENGYNYFSFEQNKLQLTRIVHTLEMLLFGFETKI